MNRIDAIKNYKVKCDMKKIEEENKKRNEIELYVERIKELNPRIKELISVANACIENGIEINSYHNCGYNNYDNWESGTFCTNGISHKIGFVWQYKDQKFIGKIEEIGIDGGGACGEFYLRTNGDYVVSKNGCSCSSNIREHNIWYLKRFVETFEYFEEAFYKYIDNIVCK